MTRFQRLMALHRLSAPEGGGEGGSGGGEGRTPEQIAADEAAAAAAKAKKGGEGDDGNGGGEGKKAPTDEEARLLKDIMAKKKENARLKEEKEALEKRFEGIDPEEVRKLLQDRSDAETRKLEEKGEWDRLKSQMVEGFNKERGTLTEQLENERKEKSELKSQIAELTVGAAFSQSKYLPEEVAMTPRKARVVYGPHFEFVDGAVVGYDKPAGQANRTMLVNSAGEPLDFDAALKSIVEADPDRDEILRSKMKTGASSSTAKNASKPIKHQVELSASEKVAKGLGDLLKA